MLDLVELKRAGEFQKPTSWIVDPIRSLFCSFLWPYFHRLLSEIEGRSAVLKDNWQQEKLQQEKLLQDHLVQVARRVSRFEGAQKDIMATQSRLVSIEKTLAEHKRLFSEFEALQKDILPTQSRLDSVEKIVTEHKKILAEHKEFFTNLQEKEIKLTRGVKVGIPGTSLVLSSGKYGQFLLRRPDLISEAIMAEQYWDAHLKQLVERLGRQKLIAIDAGCYLGFHSVHMARHFGEVYAFEPQLEIFRMLCSNILLNGIKNIRAFNNALYDSECYMQLAPASMQEIAIPFTGGAVDYDRIENAAALAFTPVDHNSTHSARGITIDSLKLDNVGFVKIDTQGSEFQVLKGAAETIARSRPVIVFEYETKLSQAHGWELAQCEEYFERLNYKLEILAVQVEEKQSDYLATPLAV